jgi:hypothetical protein
MFPIAYSRCRLSHVGVNVAGKPLDGEKFVNLKAERYRRLSERLQAGEISGLTKELLVQLATIPWLVDWLSKIEFESKASIKAVFGHSPELAEAS